MEARFASLRRRLRWRFGDRNFRLHGDLAGLFGVLVVVVVAVVRLTAGGTRIGLDSSVQFYPAYIFLGDSLRAGEIPYWNPHQYSGVPFVADLQSGWTYLPAMVLFTALPVWLAIPLWLAFHVALTSFGIYALARVLGIRPGPGLVAVIALLFSGWYWVRIGCCSVEVGVVAWMPLAYIGVEQAVRTRDRWRRALWWLLAGFAISQILAIWLGQGSYYALFALGAYVVYRTLLAPPAPWTWRRRITALAINGGAVFLLGVGFDAAAILPRLEYIGLSNLADGYPDWDGVRGGWAPLRAVERVLGRTSYYAGASTVIFAAAGLALGRRRPAVAYFGGLAFAAIFFTMKDPTPIHHLAYFLLPHFEELQRNLPERSMLVFFLPAAMLAGFAVDALVQGEMQDRRRIVALASAVVVVALAVWSDTAADGISSRTFVSLGLATAALTVGLIPVWRRQAALVAPIIMLILLVDVVPSGAAIVDAGRRGLLQVKVDLHRYYDPVPAATFLEELDRRSAEPFRFFSYAPGILRGEPDDDALYRYSFHRRTAVWLLFNNRAMTLRLDDVQGQSNPLQVGRFAEYMTTLNGVTQNYHDANVYPSGLDSPLLDLLNAKYIVLPVEIPLNRDDLQSLVRDYPTVFKDDHVRIVENTDALPRAWIVHDAQTVERGEALILLADGTVDPRTTALIETDLPPIDQPPPGVTERATATSQEPSRIVVETDAAAAGLLMLSEVSYPAWHAYVDGERVDLLVADHALRAIPIPAGQHRVELRYESEIATLGLAITGSTLIVCVLIVAGAIRHERHLASSNSVRKGESQV